MFHYVAPPAVVNHDIWPKNPAGYREANEEYCRHIQRLTRGLFQHLSLGLGLEKDAMSEAFGGDDQLVLLQKINFYPPCPQPEVTLGVGPHTDLCVVTILLPNDVEGLQVFKDGRWHDVPHVPEAFNVFMGDQIEASKQTSSRLTPANSSVLLLDRSLSIRAYVVFVYRP